LLFLVLIATVGDVLLTEIPLTMVGLKTFSVWANPS